MRTLKINKLKLRYLLSEYELVYQNLSIAGKNSQLVTPRHKLVLDGFPRSGNSYLEALVKSHMDLDHQVVGHHTHALAQFKKAKRLGIYCVCIIRNPLKVISSNVEMYAYSVQPELILELYRRFHEKLLSLNISAVKFDDVLGNEALFLDRISNATGVAIRNRKINYDLIKEYQISLSKNRTGKYANYIHKSEANRKRRVLLENSIYQEHKAEINNAFNIYERFSLI